ncbi:MAG TPA: DUF456 domain-containing protein [Dermatophilaceae bacterium]
MNGLNVLVGLIMLVGLIGIVVPVLPGLPLVWAAVLIWASGERTTAAWVVFGVATILALSGFLLQYLLPGRRMARAGVTTSSTVAGAALGIVGFFVIPVIGAFLGFALGVYLAERIKLGTHAAAWASTKHALKAVALSMGIELLTGLAIATTWVVGVTTA